MHDIVTDTMGAPAYFTPSTGGPQQTVNVLFNDPTTKSKLGEIEYNPNNDMIEYRAPFFPELKTLTDQGINQVITVKGVDYNVQRVKKLYDGDTFIAILEIPE